MSIKTLNELINEIYGSYQDMAASVPVKPKATQHECCGGTGACAKKSESFVKKTDTEIKLVIPAPGFSKKDLSITVERGKDADLLVVKGSISIPEFDFKNSLVKQVSISKDVDLAGVSVEVVDGLIKIKLPRVVKAPEVVEIKIS